MLPAYVPVTLAIRVEEPLSPTVIVTPFFIFPAEILAVVIFRIVYAPVRYVPAAID
jgi:hypothetical protein